MKSLLLYSIFWLCQVLLPAQSVLKYDETFALYVSGGGYVKYESREYGINLVWSKTPVYEWKFIKDNSSADVQLNTSVALFNLTANDYILYEEREYGINLKWLRDTKLNDAHDWQIEGTLGSRPCIYLKNATMMRKNQKPYIVYGEREYGINLVWGNKPATCNIQIIKNPVLVKVDFRTTLPIATVQDNALIQQAFKQMDVMGTNFDGEKFIGVTAAERSGVVTTHNDVWFPIDGYKRTVCGNVINYFLYQGSSWTDSDDDLNLNIFPNDDFKPIFEQATEVANQRANKPGRTFTHIQCEIDVIDAPYKDFFYPDKPFAPKMNTNVCAFGPLVTDKDHEHKPEIHTAEQIWWREVPNVLITNYMLSYMCDNSGRFDGLLDGNNTNIPNLNDTGDDYDTEGGKKSFGGPWAPKPIDGTYALAFKVPIGKERLFYKIQKKAGKYFNPPTNQPENMHYLVYNKDTIATVLESDALDVNVRFEKLSIAPSLSPSILQPSYLQGFVVLRTKTGKPFTGYEKGKRNDDGGELLLKVTKSSFKFKNVPIISKQAKQ